MFDEFLRRTKLSKQQVIYVGDTPVDIKGSINSGIDSFVIAGEHFSPEELAVYNPRRILRSITELPDAIRPIVD
jgi:phosphoglycolate phosphatase-like HAD superfamily hydrolase